MNMLIYLNVGQKIQFLIALIVNPGKTNLLVTVLMLQELLVALRMVLQSLHSLSLFACCHVRVRVLYPELSPVLSGQSRTTLQEHQQLQT